MAAAAPFEQTRAAQQAEQAAQQASASHSLWDAVYEHPVATGLAVAGAAAAAGTAFYLTRGRLAGLFGRSENGVLLIEDTPCIAKAMRAALEEQGHKVTWLTGIKTLEPLTALTPEGTEVALNTSRLARQFKFALVDGDLGKGSLTGPEIVGTLRRNRIMSIGTSTVDSFNTAMRENGAAVAGNKSIVFTSITDRRLDFNALLKSPKAVQARLDALSSAYMKPENEAARNQAEQLLQRYLKEG